MNWTRRGKKIPLCVLYMGVALGCVQSLCNRIFSALFSGPFLGTPKIQFAFCPLLNVELTISNLFSPKVTFLYEGLAHSSSLLVIPGLFFPYVRNMFKFAYDDLHRDC